jgi:CheY-like chemotaxis protein
MERADPDDNPQPTPADILLVDDDPWIVELVIMAADERGWSVQSVPDGAGALRSLREMHPRVILLDMHLPGSDGWEVLNHIRQDNPNHPPVLMMTADRLDVAVALASGAAGVINKPFAIPGFLAVLAGYIEAGTATT